MTLKDYEYIIALSKYRTISKTAAELYISQPALSKFLHRKENELGTHLFERVGNQMLPTYAGHIYIKKARQILLMAENLESEISDLVRNETGKIRIGIPLSRTDYFIEMILPDFKKNYPKVIVEISEDSGIRLMKGLRVGDLDLIFSHINDVPDDLDVTTLSEEEMVLAVNAASSLCKHGFPKEGKAFPVLLPDLWKDYGFIQASSDQNSRLFADAYFKEQGIQPPVTLKTRNARLTLQAVACNLGVSILPSIPVFPSIQPYVRYFSLETDIKTKRTVSIITRKNTYLSKAEQELISLLKEKSRK